jgi:hypothetical protein
MCLVWFGGWCQDWLFFQPNYGSTNTIPNNGNRSTPAAGRSFIAHLQRRIFTHFPLLSALITAMSLAFDPCRVRPFFRLITNDEEYIELEHVPMEWLTQGSSFAAFIFIFLT